MTAGRGSAGPPPSPVRPLVWWAGGLAALFAVLWLLGDVLMPFALGAAIAYVADPLSRRLQRGGLPRWLAVSAIMLGGAGLGVAALLVLVPMLIEQVAQMVARAPDALAVLRDALNRHVLDGAGAGEAEPSELVRSLLEALRSRAQGLSGEALASAWSGGQAVLGFAGLLVIAPVVAFYLLYDWDSVISGIDGLVPPRHRPVVRDLARGIDAVLAGFIRGQLSVCLILGAFYALALGLVGLEYGLAVGLLTGLLSFIPYIGAMLGGALAIGIAAGQFWGEPGWIAAVAVIFLVGQAVEGNVLTPRLVGHQVRLHPVWLLFALAAFGALFGFVGLLIAVPAAAAVGVLARFGLERYRASAFFTDGEESRS